jgi:hypothetical protein
VPTDARLTARYGPEPDETSIGDMVWCMVCRTYIGFVPRGDVIPRTCPNGCTVKVEMPKFVGVIRDLKG